jgi:hypothetical protein
MGRAKPFGVSTVLQTPISAKLVFERFRESVDTVLAML